MSDAKFEQETPSLTIIESEELVNPTTPESPMVVEVSAAELTKTTSELPAADASIVVEDPTIMQVTVAPIALPPTRKDSLKRKAPHDGFDEAPKVLDLHLSSRPILIIL